MHIKNQNPRVQTKIRVFAIAFLVCFLVVSILSGAFILAHTNHEHDHNGIDGSCATCAQLHNTENILKQLSSAFIAAAFTITGLFSAVMSIRAMESAIILSTPVTLKIQMKN